MLNVDELVKGVTVRIVTLPEGVKQSLGDIGSVISTNSGDEIFPILVDFETGLYCFRTKDLEVVEDLQLLQSEDLIIYKSRWDEIIEHLEGGYGMTDEEVAVVQSVLKNNLPFNVVEDPIIVDPVISKERQTHLDATHIGYSGYCELFYKSELLKKWFWWGRDNAWEDCDFSYDKTQLFSITISKSI